MFSGVVYKQRYASVKDPETRSKNIAHLIYIATRSGTVHNEGCEFGLWGKIEGQNDIGNINDFTLAQARVAQMGKDNKTVYRAIISLDNEAATEKDFYNREAWQKLICNKIAVIAKEQNMNISNSSFEWVASYHHEEGHPHCHIMFWDNSDKVRNEFISPERMEIMSENIRAEFNSEIFRDELSELRQDSDYANYLIKGDLKKSLTMLDEALLFNADDFTTDTPAYNLLCGAMLDVNPKECFNTKLSTEYLAELSQLLNRVTIMLPETGSLKYTYLNQYTKKAVDNIVDKLLENSDYKRLQSKYIDINAKISEVYGNSEKSIIHNTEKATTKLKADLGNCVLKTLKTLTLDTQNGIDYFSTLENDILTSSLGIAKSNELYEQFAKNFSTFRMPNSRIIGKDDWKNLNKLVGECIGSERSDDYINLFLKLDQNENFNSKFHQEIILKVEQYKTLQKGFKILLAGLDEIQTPSADYPEAFDRHKKARGEIEALYKKVSGQMIVAIIKPMKDELRNELLDVIKREKGWYDFSDKISYCSNSDELKPYLDNTKSIMSKRIHELISSSSFVGNAVQKLINSMPKRMQPYNTFYTDEFSKNMKTVINLLSSDETINTQVYNYLDCLDKENSFSLADKSADEKLERKLMFSQIFKDIHNEVISHCVDAKGWDSLYKQDMALKLATIVFGEISQTLGQEKNNLKSIRSRKDMSKSQKKELSRKLESATEWDEEI